MTPEELRALPAPPQAGPAIRALWWAARGDWERAHGCAQEAEATPDADWVHAYLHRVEGDEGNAGYWYPRAGRPVGSGGFEQEWDGIARELLAD